MALIEWQYGEQPLTGSKSHWFAAHLDFENGNLLIIVPYTDDYGSGSPPWTVTLTAFAIDPSGNVISAPVPLATYATGFDFAVSDVGLTGHQTAVFWTSANGTYPASSAVDLNFRPIDANGNPVGTATTLLSDVNDLEQFRVSSAGTGGTSVGVAYSTYDASTRAEVIRFKGFNPDGTPIATEDVSLDGFTGEVGYDSFGFGTLTPASGAKPSFIYLRAVDDEDGNVGLSYRTIGTNGVATAASVPVALPYSDGSSNRHLVDWLWDRLDPPAAGANNLVTVALLAEKGVHGYADDKIDVQIIDTDSGVSTEDTILFQNPSLTTDIELAETRLANGGVVIGYSSDGYSELKFYDNAGDVIGLFTFNIPHDPTTFSLETLPDGRLAVVYPTDAGDALAYNVFTVPTGPIDYDIHAGSTRNGIELREYDIMTVEAGGKAVGTIVDQFGNGIYVHSGGATSGTILNGGDEQILAGAFAEGTIIAAGATQNVVTGGVATGTLINNGQQMTAGTTKGTTINSGFQFAGQPSQDFDTVIETGGSQWLNGHAYRTVINGGNEDVQVSGVAINATVTAGNQDVENEGAAFGTTVNGGQQYVEIGGSATNTTVNDGGKLVVDAEGVLQGVIAGGAVLGVTINAGGVAQLVGDAVTVGESTTEGLINHGSLTKTAGTGTATITANLQGSGGSAALIAVSVGTLQFNGASNNFAAQAITGAGTFTIGGGGASTIGAGTSIGTAGFVIGAGGTTVALAESLAYAGSFRQASSSVVDLGANTLTLSGPASFNLGGKGSPTVTGASGGVLAVTGAVTIRALTIGGAATVVDTGPITATGQLTIGDTSSQVAKLTVRTGGSYTLAADVGITAGGTGATINLAGGKLLKTAGTGLSAIAPAIVDNNATAVGIVRVSSGTLRLDGAVSGNIQLRAQGGTLTMTQAVGSGVQAMFTGPNAQLQLADAQDFHGTIAGFAGGETLDLRSIAFNGTSATPAYAPTSSSAGTLTVGDGTHTASLAMLGSYTTGNFHAADDQHGGTAIAFA